MWISFVNRIHSMRQPPNASSPETTEVPPTGLKLADLIESIVIKLFPVASAGEGAIQKRPQTTYYERNCKKLLTGPPIPDRFGPPGNSILTTDRLGDRDKTGPSLSTDTQSNPSINQTRQPYTFPIVLSFKPQCPFSVGRCSYGRMTFEKVSGYELDRGQKYLLFKHTVRGISDSCAKRCQSDIKCHAFNLDYNRNECSALEFANDEVRFGLRRSAGVAYFEGICLRGKSLGPSSLEYRIQGIKVKLNWRWWMWTAMDVWADSKLSTPWVWEGSVSGHREDTLWGSMLGRTTIHLQIRLLWLEEKRMSPEYGGQIHTTKGFRGHAGFGLPRKSMRPTWVNKPKLKVTQWKSLISFDFILTEE